MSMIVLWPSGWFLSSKSESLNFASALQALNPVSTAMEACSEEGNIVGETASPAELET